jgi:hypothetical protein
MFQPTLTGFRRANAALMGEFNLAGRTYEEALGEARQMGDTWAQAAILWLRAGAGRVTAGSDPVGFLGDYASAEQLFAEMGARPYRARVLRDWGHALNELGRGEEGREKVGQAVNLLDDMGLDREAEMLKAELDAPSGGGQS